MIEQFWGTDGAGPFQGQSMKFASLPAMDDGDLFIEAMKLTIHALKYAPYELWCDRTFVVEATRRCGLALKYASEELRNDRKVILEAIRQNPAALGHASADARCDRKFLLSAISANAAASALVFRYVSDALRKNHSFMLQALVENADVVLGDNGLPQELRRSATFMCSAVKVNKKAWVQVAPELLRNHFTFDAM